MEKDYPILIKEFLEKYISDENKIEALWDMFIIVNRAQKEAFNRIEKKLQDIN